MQFLIETQLGTEGGVSTQLMEIGLVLMMLGGQLDDEIAGRLWGFLPTWRRRSIQGKTLVQAVCALTAQAEESLRRAEREPNPAERRAYLDDALRYVLREVASTSY